MKNDAFLIIFMVKLTFYLFYKMYPFLIFKQFRKTLQFFLFRSKYILKTSKNLVNLGIVKM